MKDNLKYIDDYYNQEINLNFIYKKRNEFIN